MCKILNSGFSRVIAGHKGWTIHPRRTTNLYVETSDVIFEVRDLFPWEMLTKMVISCLLDNEKIWNSAQINLSSTLNFYRKYVFDATISTEKSTSYVVKWHTNYTYVKFSSAFSWNCDFGQFLIKFMTTKNAVFCRLAQEFEVSYETSIFWSMFMLPKYWYKQLSWRNGIRY